RGSRGERASRGETHNERTHHNAAAREHSLAVADNRFRPNALRGDLYANSCPCGRQGSPDSLDRTGRTTRARTRQAGRIPAAVSAIAAATGRRKSIIGLDPEARTLRHRRRGEGNLLTRRYGLVVSGGDPLWTLQQHQAPAPADSAACHHGGDRPWRTLLRQTHGLRRYGCEERGKSRDCRFHGWQGCWAGLRSWKYRIIRLWRALRAIYRQKQRDASGKAGSVREPHPPATEPVLARPSQIHHQHPPPQLLCK